MSLPAHLREDVRRRASYACEYCGVTETDVGGELTIDHFQPQAWSGTDDPSNLIYCCHRCNLYKADFWVASGSTAGLWNPRSDPVNEHLLLTNDGVLHPLSERGATTIQVLRLNRPPLLAYRRQRRFRAEQESMLQQYREMMTALAQLHREHGKLLREHRKLLNEQQMLLRLFPNE